MSDTTRIMDLPENITMQMNPSTRGDGINTSYSPIDVHPNPYGHPPPSVPSIPNPSGTSNMQSLPPVPPSNPTQNFQESHTNMYPPQQQHVPTVPPNQVTLPSRDIPQNTANLVQDIQVQPNYVPPVSDSNQKTADYMKQYDAINEEKIRTHNAQIAKEQSTDDFMEKIQLPVLVMLLFFIFHMPIVDTFVFKRLSFLSIHNADGNFNMNGMILQSVLFGVMIYFLQYIRNFMASL